MSIYANKVVTITGGTGSFGGQFVRHLLRTEVGEIRVVSRDEAKQDAMRHELRDDRLRFYLGDVRDASSLRPVFKKSAFVLHAAALKQVPACESFPEQAFATNVLGSQNVIEEAARAGAERLVCISTDKSVYPINAMGMTKALMEKLVQASAGRDIGTNVSCVRYGNVVSSRGSVVPVFADQIRRNRPLTITLPEMTRFLLTLADAVELIEFALIHAEPGDIFIRKSPAATVATIAEAMTELYGARQSTVAIGIRPGEKIHETLSTFSELARATEYPEFFRISMTSQQSGKENSDKIEDCADFTSDRASILECAAVKDLLMTIEAIAADVTQHQRMGSLV